MHKDEKKKITRGDLEFGFGLFGAGFGVAFCIFKVMGEITFSISSMFEFIFWIFAGVCMGMITGGATGYIVCSI